MIGRRHFPVLGWGWVSSSSDVELDAAVPLISEEPVLVPDRPWEKLLSMYTSVLPGQNGEHLLYYRVHPGLDEHHPSTWLHHCLSTSRDGIRWDRPDLGNDYEDFRGGGYKLFRNTNVVIPGWSEMTMFYDAADPEYPYKSMSKEQFATDRGIRIWKSRDGIRWEHGTTNVFPFHCDGSDWAFWDERIGKYVVYLRAFASALEQSHHRHPHLGRSVGRIEMDDIEAPWPLLSSEATLYPFAKCGHPDVACICERNVSLAFEAKEDDIESIDYYDTFVDRIEGGYIALVSTLVNIHPYPADLCMATSDDGVHWKFPSATALVPTDPGRPEQMLVPVKGRIRCDDTYDAHFFIKIGSAHNDIFGKDVDGNPQLVVDTGMYMMRHRRGGHFFLHPREHNREGRLITEVLTVPRGAIRLRLNLNASTFGFVKVGILDEDGGLIPDLSVDDCDLVRGNELRAGVSWNGRHGLPLLADRPIRLDIRIVGAKLYGFELD